MRVSAVGVRAAIWVNQASGQHGGASKGAATGRRRREGCGDRAGRPTANWTDCQQRLETREIRTGGVSGSLGRIADRFPAQGWRGRAALEPWNFLAITDVGGARRRIGLCVERFAPESYDGQADGPELLGVGPLLLRHVHQGATGRIAACNWRLVLQPL